jgi:hypothetical protein
MNPTSRTKMRRQRRDVEPMCKLTLFYEQFGEEVLESSLPQVGGEAHDDKGEELGGLMRRPDVEEFPRPGVMTPKSVSVSAVADPSPTRGNSGTPRQYTTFRALQRRWRTR